LGAIDKHLLRKTCSMGKDCTKNLTRTAMATQNYNVFPFRRAAAVNQLILKVITPPSSAEQLL
jgi:hypothetical protein